jgi:HAD superfamily hydrolase (TIGR01549 family)
VDPVIFDLDGTLLDSDRALVDAFVALGIPESEVTFGHPVGAECRRLGLTVERYVAAYDTAAAQPFPGVEALLGKLPRWGICSNKAGPSARAELRRLGWVPEISWFAEDFGGEAKSLRPLVEELGFDPAGVRRLWFVGDSLHDLRCAREVGCRFAWAGWNPRTRRALAGSVGPGVVLDHPLDLLGLIG